MATTDAKQKQACRGRKYPFRDNYSLFPSVPVAHAASIPMTQGRHAIVDIEDFDLVSPILWHLGNKGYARTDRCNVAIPKQKLMHRLMLDCPEGMFVDHINGNKLDNRRSNLRLCSVTENNWARHRRHATSSKYKGVAKDGNRWRAAIYYKLRTISLGTFPTEEAAAEFYNEMAVKLFGEFAVLNQIAAPKPQAQEAGE